MASTSIWDLDTPTLLLDGPASERNLRKAAEVVRGSGARLRPHFKNHKCVSLARRQREAGEWIGMTVAKLAEAEILLQAGFDDILVANQVVGPRKMERLAQANRRGIVRVAVDSVANAETISQAAAAKGQRVGVLIEVDIGMSRCGVAPGEPALELAKKIHRLPGIRIDGLQAYEGHAMGIFERKQRLSVARESLEKAIATRELIEKSGIPLALLSGGGSATLDVATTIKGIDEVQIGSYATMDWSYARMAGDRFEIALSVLATVISVATDRLVLDVGVKGLGDEMGPPRLRDYPDFVVTSLKSEEHCVVSAPGHKMAVGDKVRLHPSHCCTTCNLYREMVVHDGDQVVAVWPIEGSGAQT